jgi:hypothetical protein
MPREKLTYLQLYPGVTKQVWMWYPTKDVILKGEIYQFKDGLAGLTMACGFANMWTDPKNSTRIQHPAKKGTVVIKSRAFVLTGEKSGILRYAAYGHSHGNLIDMNDDRLTAQMIRSHPEELEKEFEFRAISTVKRSGKSSARKTVVGKRKPFYPRGANARAVKAGFMTPQEAQKRAQESQDAYELQRLMGAMHRK